MPDAGDLAADRAQQQLDQHLAAQRAMAANTSRPTPDGFCHHCDQGLINADQIFCNARCAEQWKP